MPKQNIIFVSYADGIFEKNLNINGFFAKYFMKADRLFLKNRNYLMQNEIYEKNKLIFDSKRGAGYWAWKPWIILEAMNSANIGDMLIYQDCGFGFRYKTILRPSYLIKMANDLGCISGVEVPQYGANKKWVRRYCIENVGEDNSDYLESCGTEATISFWVCNDKNKAFLQGWLRNCLDYENIRDARPDEIPQENPHFVEHRHDQAVLTMMVIKNKFPNLIISPQIYDFSKSITILELDQRAKYIYIYKILLSIICRLFSFRRTITEVLRRFRQ